MKIIKPKGNSNEVGKLGISSTRNTGNGFATTQGILCFSACKSECATSCQTNCGSKCATQCATQCKSSCWTLCSGGSGDILEKMYEGIEKVIL